MTKDGVTQYGSNFKRVSMFASALIVSKVELFVKWVNNRRK